MRYCLTGTSHRVNSIVVMKRSRPDGDDELEIRPSKRICKRSLPTHLVTKELPDYYRGKRVGPEEKLDNGSTYRNKVDDQRKLLKMSHMGGNSEVKNPSSATNSRLDRF